MTRDEWLAAKRKAVSSTESPALFQLSPYATAYELAIAKSSGIDIDVETTDRMRWGTRLQDAIAQGISDDYGVVIEGCEYEFMRHRDEPRMGTSLDYRIIAANKGGALAPLYHMHGPGLLEIKNVDALVYKTWPEHDAPDHIEIQVQHQMEVAEVAWCVLGVLVGGNKTEVYTRMRDGAVGAAIVRKVRKFWHDLDKGILPDPILPADADIIIKLHQYSNPNTVLDAQKDVSLASLCEEYHSAGEVARKAIEAQKSLKAQILTTIGDAERALVDGYNVSAAMVAEVPVKAYTRAAYRNFRVTKNERRIQS